jgi:hypothetical protein
MTTTKKITPIQPLTAWSFSRYSTYKQCPLKVKLTAIDKHKEPGNKAMERGNQIHNLAEAYIKGTIKALPPELKLFKDEFKKLKTMFKKDPESMVVEDQWSFTSLWDRTGWFDKDCWARIKLDCAYHISPTRLKITDWKTGKFREESNQDYLEQLELYALSAMLLHPHIEYVEPRLVYLDLGIEFPGVGQAALQYTRKDIPKLKKIWEKRVQPMLSDTVFPPRPNDKCRWCHFGQSGVKNGGPGVCKY